MSNNPKREYASSSTRVVWRLEAHEIRADAEYDWSGVLGGLAEESAPEHR